MRNQKGLIRKKKTNQWYQRLKAMNHKILIYFFDHEARNYLLYITKAKKK